MHHSPSRGQRYEGGAIAIFAYMRMLSSFGDDESFVCNTWPLTCSVSDVSVHVHMVCFEVKSNA